MDIDKEQCLLEQLTSYGQYIDPKPPEKTTRMKIEEPEEKITDRQTLEHFIALREYRSYKDFESCDDVFTRKGRCGRLKGKPVILNEEHQEYLVRSIDKSSTLVLD